MEQVSIISIYSATSQRFRGPELLYISENVSKRETVHFPSDDTVTIRDDSLAMVTIRLVRALHRRGTRNIDGKRRVERHVLFPV